MPRVRIHFSKRGAAIFVPHAELPVLFTRAARRARLEMELTQGFTRRPRTAFGPPLPVGVVGLREPAEFWFADWGGDSLDRWRRFVPEGFEIICADEADGVSLSKLCQAASYIIEPVRGVSTDEAESVLGALFRESGALLSLKTEENRILISVTDLERSGASKMVKALVSASVVSGWRELSITRYAVGNWDAAAVEVISLARECHDE
jgi:radical SAM-linked protein